MRKLDIQQWPWSAEGVVASAERHARDAINPEVAALFKLLDVDWRYRIEFWGFVIQATRSGLGGRLLVDEDDINNYAEMVACVQEFFKMIDRADASLWNTNSPPKWMGLPHPRDR